MSLVIEEMDIKKLKPSDYNPRKISDSEIEKLKNSIKEFGYVDPIIINKRTGNIVGGHQRYKALEDLGFEKVDVIVLDVGAGKEKALNVALNKISGDWDVERLKDVLDEIDGGSMDIELSGFELSEVEEMFNSSSAQEFNSSELDLDDFEDENFDCMCPECGFYFNK
ncbi:ParB N-terminal domain-containing protein [Halobacillus sp. H74]|uniref:ParB N-terminal domain-containing protein n=1 Tax=Halobacillus sp. H74 TaxID=3457436 RepID=UPI003FCC97C2